MASCTLFSPKLSCPNSIKGKICSNLNVFETAIIFGDLSISFKSDNFDLTKFCILIKFCTVLCIKIYLNNTTL